MWLNALTTVAPGSCSWMNTLVEALGEENSSIRPSVSHQ